jgi:hypothetical protein
VGWGFVFEWGENFFKTREISKHCKNLSKDPAAFCKFSGAAEMENSELITELRS